MSEGGEAGVVRHDAGGLPHHQRVASVFCCACADGPDSRRDSSASRRTSTPALASGWYSLPMAAFGHRGADLAAAQSEGLLRRRAPGRARPVRAVGLERSARHARLCVRPRHRAAPVRLAPDRARCRGVRWSACSPTGRRRSRSHFPGRSAAPCWSSALIPITYYSEPHRPPRPRRSAGHRRGGASAPPWCWRSHSLLKRVAPRGPLFITAATLIFAVTVRPLGLVFASFVSLMVSAYATDEIRWIETMIWAVVLTIFCSLLFP